MSNMDNCTCVSVIEIIIYYYGLSLRDMAEWICECHYRPNGRSFESLPHRSIVDSESDSRPKMVYYTEEPGTF